MKHSNAILVNTVSSSKFAVSQSDADVQFYIGWCYANGQGVEKNEAEAVRFYSLAAIKGHANAQFHLGYCYANGQGVVKNLFVAAGFYRLAAAQGHADAQCNFGACFANHSLWGDMRKAVEISPEIRNKCFAV